jgi:hypothetical protein
MNLSHVRLDACKSGISEISPLNDSYTLESCDTFSVESLDMTEPTSLLGNGGHDLVSKTYIKDAIINLGANAEGAITFYLTVMDDAGNFDTDLKIYKLEQWAVVKDGFVFGKKWVTSSTRKLKNEPTDPDVWSTHSLLSQFDESKIDLTNQVLLGAYSLSEIYLRDLVNTSNNKSFIAANYPGIFLGLPYQELRDAYKRKTAKLNF